MVAVTAGLMRMFPWVFPVLFMAAGVAASTFPLRLPQDVPAPLLWLGRVSYSLYLSHAVVLAALGPLGVVLVLPVAWALWWAVERPSILWSRRVGPALLPARAKA
jgi:peptidoglycan/LPS O-acetylase OafA/YrhL